MSLSVVGHPDTAPSVPARTPPSPLSQVYTEVIADGDLDTVTLPAFARAIDEAVASSDRVEVDLSGVEFMSIDAAAYIWRQATRRGVRSIEISAASPQAARALVVTGFGGIIGGERDSSPSTDV